MKTLGRKTPYLFAVLLLASAFSFGERCSEPAVSLNVVGQNLIVRRDIRAEDLNVAVDGKRTQVVSLSLNSSPRRVLLMVDTSASMHPSAQKGGWGIALRTAAFAFDSIPSDASGALLTFGRGRQSQMASFRDRSELAPKIVELANQEPQGPTALLDSIDQALSLFQPAQLGDAIYLVTDGVDNRSNIPIRKLKEELIARGIRVFVFLVPIEGYVPAKEEAAQSQFIDIAEYTGGYLVQVPWDQIGADKQKGIALAAEISNQVQSMYQATLALRSQGESKGKVKIDVSRRKPGKETLVYPRQLAPCLSTP